MADQITRDEFTDYMEAFEQRLAARFARADRRLDGIEGRLDEVDGRFDGLEFRHDCAGAPPHRASDCATRGRVDDAIAQRTYEHIDRLSAQVERCARLLEDLEERLNIASQDTRDDRMAFSDAAIELPADAFVNTDAENVTAPKKEAPARVRTIKKADGTRVESPVASRLIRKETRPPTKPRAPSPLAAATTVARQRRRRTETAPGPPASGGASLKARTRRSPLR